MDTAPPGHEQAVGSKMRRDLAVKISAGSGDPRRAESLENELTATGWGIEFEEQWEKTTRLPAIDSK